MSSRRVRRQSDHSTTWASRCCGAASSQRAGAPRASGACDRRLPHRLGGRPGPAATHPPAGGRRRRAAPVHRAPAHVRRHRAARLALPLANLRAAAGRRGRRAVRAGGEHHLPALLHHRLPARRGDVPPPRHRVRPARGRLQREHRRRLAPGRSRGRARGTSSRPTRRRRRSSPHARGSAYVNFLAHEPQERVRAVHDAEAYAPAGFAQAPLRPAQRPAAQPRTSSRRHARPAPWRRPRGRGRPGTA
jgi:hypothetical protein